MTDSACASRSLAVDHCGYPVDIAALQGRFLRAITAVLNTSRDQMAGAIKEALALTAELTVSDLCCVFRLRDNSMRMTHEWTVPGAAGKFDRLDDLPVQAIGAWLPQLQNGRAFEIPQSAIFQPDIPLVDVTLVQSVGTLLVVPMLRDGSITGFLGLDAVHRARSFLAVEILLVESIATVIGVIMDRVEAEIAADTARAGLQAERQKLQTTLAAMPELVLELDANGRFVAFNNTCQLAPTLRPDVFIGKRPEEFLPAALAQLLHDLLQSSRHTSGPQGSDYEMTIDGELRSFFATAAPIAREDGTGGFVVVVRDTTRQRKHQSQLLSLGKIAELTASLVIVADANGLIDWVNPAFERQTGWRLDEVRGKDSFLFLLETPSDVMVTQKISNAIRLHEPFRTEGLLRNRSGDGYWVSTDIQPLIGQNGQTQGFVAVQTDISALKLSHEKALQDRVMAMDASIDGIAICDNTGHYTYMNKAYRQMYAIAPDDDISCLHWTDLCPPDVASNFVSNEWPIMAVERTWRGQVVGLSRNKDLLQNEVSLTLKEDGGLLCIARDIAPRLKANLEQAELREALQLAQRQETIAQITAGVVHDLNNIVAVVAGATSMLETQLASNPQALIDLARISRATDTARNLVAGLDRMGRREPKCANHDLRALVTRGRDLLGSDRLEKYAISLKLPQNNRPVLADPTELLQVIVNLAMNACEAGPPGTNRISIEVLAADSPLPARLADVGFFRSGQRYSCFVISDTGCGVSEDIREHMFDSYFTTKGQAGTGLGLPIVASILESNHSAMWFDSTPMQGSTVTVAWLSNRLMPVQVAHRASDSTGNVDLAGLNILVVDDIGDVADVLAEMLEAAGAVAVAVSDAPEAAALCSENPGVWSALVTDLHMPHVNGVDLAHLAGQQVPRIPTVLVTALPERASQHAALFDVILSKPTDAARLIDAVKTAVSLRQRENSAP